MVDWDLAVVGAGPAGLSAAYTAARAGMRTVVLERAVHPRYKTCGGGLIGTSLAVAGDMIEVPAHDRVDRVTFTRDGRRGFTRRQPGSPLVTMVRRAEFDDRLRAAAVAAGARVRERAAVRAVAQDPEGVRLRLADGSTVTARAVVGADGSSGVTARHVGVRYRQVDLGLELELPVPPAERDRWRGRVLLDWGPLPGSYAWVFPKDDLLTVGVIAARGAGERTREYLRAFVDRLGLAGIEPAHDSGHLTRCRSADSPLRRGRVLVAGDAAGLLEPWSREGISYALRSGALAGAAVTDGDLSGYERAVTAGLVPSMRAGHRLLDVFARRPEVFHGLLATPPGWRMFVRFCQGASGFEETLTRAPVRAALALLDRLPAR
ncbi:geranylgeranyl reductase family protein [Micromonospora endolithica]|uniref:Geranylgeranyl reductase family protein n=1 Tax=Micromonospora endolithica TaxID=230091 RepID=A0A3A9YXC6_9ACTN|nr:geranylgeranyl reductase family protein [Micromonospora endolithica]RKN40688.1 geranylgeranyl reductase family protein [Micromonospora endolithica]TWJ21782.1 geranylgeranyl reductase family protein [Micromonospora endolithica]